MNFPQATGDKYEPNIFLCGNHNGHHRTESRTQRHIIGEYKKKKDEQHGPHQKPSVIK